MCMSVPQIAVLAISISTSLGPTLGSGMSSSQIPGAACCLTSAFMICSLKHAELAADAGEGVHGALELLARERRGHLRADARLPFGDDRIGEADDIYAALQQAVSHAPGERRVPDHHRDDGMLARLELEAGPGEAGAEQTRVLEQLRAQLRGVLQELEHREARGGYHRRNAVGEEVGTRTLPQPLDDFSSRGDVAAAPPAEGLAQRAGEDVDARGDAAVLGRTPPRGPHEAGGMRIINHHQGVVARRQIADLAQAGDEAIHREYAVGGDEARARALRLAETVLELRHVAVGVAVALRLAQANAVDDARVIEGVRDHRVALIEERLEQAPVGVEAG